MTDQEATITTTMPTDLDQIGLHLPTLRELFRSMADSGREDEAAALAFAVIRLETWQAIEQRRYNERISTHARVQLHSVEAQYKRALSHRHLWYWVRNSKGKPTRVLVGEPVSDEQGDPVFYDEADRLLHALPQGLLDESLLIARSSLKPWGTQLMMHKITRTALRNSWRGQGADDVNVGLYGGYCKALVCPFLNLVEQRWRERLAEAQRQYDQQLEQRIAV